MIILKGVHVLEVRDGVSIDLRYIKFVGHETVPDCRIIRDQIIMVLLYVTIHSTVDYNRKAFHKNVNIP